ncbi:MAG: metal-dependent hydrolase [Betaproteobacteria bacterium HGW-Betaproteobacteria-18]|nr:MAG: metal-dependent hydrolase [Betaproteobacteria bacterium HGW-Betaproteobacteria-2]PKO59426.1 MAG: metal-dependent hydrolase [Betaproteobacteria bacterium HGW-Betaproteobacteria-18]
MNTISNDIDEWVAFLGKAEIPVLRNTARELRRLQADEEKLSLRGITQVVSQDPMMVFRILRYMQQHKRENQLQDLILVEQAIMMMGMSHFFRDLPPDPTVDDVMRNDMVALTHLLKLIRRAHRAAHYSYEWGVMQKDFHVIETRTAALLHDLAEMLLWCFAADRMMAIFRMQQADKSLRSHIVQMQVLGFKIMDLQLRLIEHCELPPLLSRLMQDDAMGEQQVRNVTLAVKLARHSANGWDDAALPDDYKDIADFLRIDTEKVKQIVGADSGNTA